MGAHVAMMKFLLAVCLVAATFAASGPTDTDFHRAITKIPRAGYRGDGSIAAANRVLNKHLDSFNGLETKPCEALSLSNVKDAMRTIFSASHPDLIKIYDTTGDRRAQLFETAAAMEAAWATTKKLVEGDDKLTGIHRDGLCHQAVMWFTHHLAESTQVELASTGLVLPKLPVAEHNDEKSNDNRTNKVLKEYNDALSCQNCHVGGIANLGVPEERPTTDKQLARRCYTNYKELFGITCGPCDGIAGPYWGDDDNKYFTPDPCKIIGTPEQVPEADRVPAIFPDQFSVTVAGGSDRWGRTTNPTGHVKTPFPPIIDSMYGQITGHWFVDITKDSDLWMLRHDTHYADVTFNGTRTPFKFDVSEIHAQTKAQQAVNNSGPMVSLIHGLPNFLPGGCTCVADPVGVPDVHHERTTGLDEMTYLGRINLTLTEYDHSSVVVDHWANWFFHVFMEVDKDTTRTPYGKAPIRLASAYAGTAVYANWTLRDPKIDDPKVWTRGIPLTPERVGPSRGKFCLNPTKIDMCNNISTTSFPPTPEAALAPRATPWGILHKSFMSGYAQVNNILDKRH